MMKICNILFAAIIVAILFVPESQAQSDCRGYYSAHSSHGFDESYSRDSVVSGQYKLSKDTEGQISGLVRQLNFSKELVADGEPNKAMLEISWAYNLILELNLGERLNPCLKGHLQRSVLDLSGNKFPIKQAGQTLYYEGWNFLDNKKRLVKLWLKEDRFTWEVLTQNDSPEASKIQVTKEKPIEESRFEDTPDLIAFDMCNGGILSHDYGNSRFTILIPDKKAGQFEANASILPILHDGKSTIFISGQRKNMKKLQWSYCGRKPFPVSNFFVFEFKKNNFFLLDASGETILQTRNLRQFISVLREVDARTHD